MKVLQVYKDYFPPVRGGIEGHINLLANGLKRRGYDVSVLVSNTGFRLLEEEIDGIRVTRVPQLGRLTSAPLNATFIHWLRKLAREADVLHFHFPNPTAELSYLMTGLDKRVIVTYHSDIVRQERLGKIYSPFMERFLDKAETIIATSPAYLNSSAVLNQYRFKCRVVPLGIDLSRFSPEKADAASILGVRRAFPRPILLFIGRFRYYKGLGILIDAMKEINAVLLIIGTGPLERALREQAAAADLRERVVFLGERSDRDLVTYLHACDLFVLPSVLRSEAFGIVQIEAMACRKPVVSTEIMSGTSFVNQHGKTGLVVPPFSAHKLAGAVNLMLERPDLREAFGNAGYERVRRHFTSETMIDRVASIYHDRPLQIARPGRPMPAKPPRVPGGIIERPSEKKIKVLLIISRLNIGGPASHVHLLATGLNPRKFETRVVTGRISSGEGNMAYLFRPGDSRPLMISELQREIRPILDIRAFLQILRLIGRERPDIVHTHTAKAGFTARFAVILYNALRKQNVAMVHTFHGHVFEGYFNRLRSAMFVNIERFLGRAADAVLAISPSQKRDLVHTYRIGSPKKIQVIELGFDLTPFRAARKRRGAFRERMGVPADDVLIGIVGRLVPIKNHRLFLHAAGQVLATHPGRPITFAVVGDGELRSELESECRALGIAEFVKFCGWIKEIPMVYADLDILALTSNNEGTPVSIIEAMAASVPVIATDAGGVGDLLGGASGGRGKNGFAVCERGVLCRRQDADVFAEGLNYLIAEDAAAGRERTTAARRYVEAQYGRDRLIRKIESLYKGLRKERESH
ncbi:glycosyltransferase [Desulfococcus sp.]|uniref:glycosyltransferase n=1 Tax=Desulfococcus sp. TaxID=2025834 RepID=UPI00359442E1